MIKIYTLPDCPHCDIAKKFFKDNSLKYKEINLKQGGNKDTIEMKKKFKQLGIDTVPVIVIDDEYIISELDEDLIWRILNDRKKERKERNIQKNS